MGKLLKLSGLAVLVLCCGKALAQKTVGDFIESKSYNTDKRNVQRSQQYYPEGKAFACVNGSNRFTRALYGGYTDYRVETSDRPVFAVVKKGKHRNIRFVCNGVALDSTEYCKAWYENGMRSYLLKDSRWGKQASLQVKVAAFQESEGAIWQFDSQYFDSSVKFKALICNIAITKLQRNGDIGVEKPGVFEHAPGQDGLITYEWEEHSLGAKTHAKNLAAGETSYFSIDNVNEIRPLKNVEGEKLMAQAVKYNEALAGRITFNTPDPYINTIGGALVMAADGDWDGQTWLHGCIGWRMPLAGWRAGYLGDVLGWNDRAQCHFDAYAKSQVTDVPATIPHPAQDPKMNMARAEKKWGTQMYSNGYICRNPERNDQMHHYDMNLNYIDELLWHFQYNADTAYMRKMWPVIASHLAWEKRNYDPDGDHLYDAYCCIWASDALYYNGGAVTHSSAYNYRGNLLAARIAEIIGENPVPYRTEAAAILKAMNERLWLNDKGHWIEYQDFMGLKRQHESAAVWSVYTPIDCGACSAEQAYRAIEYIKREIPHIDVENTGLQTIATTNWLPYSWSINNVAAAEVMHTALACYEAGQAETGFKLMKANIMDQMYYGQSPGNFGQISHYDAARGECYRDFGDCIGISSRAFLQGLFGIMPDALNGRCIIRPGFPSAWTEASVHTPYMEYTFKRENGKDIYEIRQNFAQPLQIVLRQNLGGGRYRDIAGTAAANQVITADCITVDGGEAGDIGGEQKTVSPSGYGLDAPDLSGKFRKQIIDTYFNSKVDDIYKNQYLSPRPPYTSLEIPVQGIGEWCHPTLTADINDSVFRTLITNDEFVVAGVPFRTPKVGKNIVYTSLWDNYPDSVAVSLKGKASNAYLLMAGSTNHMQSRIDNGLVIAVYQDGTSDTLALRNPDNWCPIESDYFVDGRAFSTTMPRPYRVCLGNGMVSRDLGAMLGLEEVYVRPIPGGAAQMLKMRLNPHKRLRCITLRTLSNDVVIGLMGVTLQ
jgi:hypothetical protein